MFGLHVAQPRGDLRGGRFARIALVGALVASTAFSVFAPQSSAQADPLLATSTVVPADVAFYVETRLDPTTDQFQMLDRILQSLGSEEPLVDLIPDAAGAADEGIDLVDAEVALAVLPSALQSTTDAASSLGEIGTDIDTDAADEFASTASGEGVVVIVRAADPDALEAEIRDEAGIDAPSEEYLGSEIVTDVDEGGEPAYFAFVDDFMLAGDSSDDLKLFIDASLDGGEALAGVEAFATASSLLPAERFGYAFVNGPVVFDVLVDEIDDPSVSGMLLEAFVDFTGYTGMAFIAQTAGIQIDAVTIPTDVVPASSPNSAALTMAERMPIDTVVFADGQNLGQSTVMRSIGLLLISALTSATTNSMDEDSIATPEPMTSDEMYAAFAQLLGINLKTDLIDQMTGEYGFGVWGIGSGNTADLNVALVSGVNDVELTTDSIGTISLLVQAAGQGEINVMSREVETGSIMNVTFEADGQPMSVDFGVVGDELILGIGDGADMVTAGPSETLADSSQYQQALSYLPTDFTSVFYIDVEALATASMTMDGGMMDDGGMMNGGMDCPAFMNCDDGMMGGGTGMGMTSPIESIAAVGWTEDGYNRSSAILVIPAVDAAP